MFERETYFLAQGLDRIQAKYFPSATAPVAFHASALRAPRDRMEPPYNALSEGDRRALISDVYTLVNESRAKVFAIAMEKILIDGDPYERGFEEVIDRFDKMLSRVWRDRGEQQRGLIVVAESSYRENLELLANKIAAEGHRWGQLHQIADIPYFAPAKSTRLLQLADFVTNAIYGRYESGYTRDFDRLAPKFDQADGRLHGLVHIARDRANCYCPACVTRRALPRAEAESEEPESL